MNEITDGRKTTEGFTKSIDLELQTACIYSCNLSAECSVLPTQLLCVVP